MILASANQNVCAKDSRKRGGVEDTRAKVPQVGLSYPCTWRRLKELVFLLVLDVVVDRWRLDSRTRFLKFATADLQRQRVNHMGATAYTSQPR